MRALIIDDHPIARRGLAAVLEGALDLDCIDVAGAASEALALARSNPPDFVLMDMRLPGSIPARELCVQLRALLPSARIVLVTAFGRPAEVRDCLQAGATACLLKDTSETDLEEALRSISSGKVTIDPRVAQQLATQLVAEGARPAAVRLTARERDVLTCLAAGQSNREIAEQLLISEATVKDYVSSLLGKLGASSRLKAVVRADDLGLL